MMGQDDVLDSGLSRTEVVRLITQSLYSLGYQRSAQLLEDESRIQLLSAEVAKFRRGVLEGRWDEAAGHIPALGLASAEAARAARFLLLEQQYLELVDEQAFEPALALLRDQLVPLSAFSERLPALASCLLCAQAGELRERCGWAALGAGASEVRAAARHRLLHGLQALLPPRALLPERRMEALLLQALEQTHPRAAAGGSAACHSLLQDQPPAEPPLAPACVAQLDGHAGEAWCVAFSACGHALASAGRDGGLRIWAVPGGARAGGGAEAGAAHGPAGGACAGDNATAEAAAEAAPAAAPAQPAGALAPVCYLQWSPDDSHVLACCTDGALKLWAAAGGCGVVRTYRRHAQGAQACAWLVGGRHFVSAGLDKLLLLWDVGGAVLQAFHGIRARDLALCAGGGRLLVLCADQRLRVYGVQACERGGPRLGKASELALTMTTPVSACALSRDSSQLLVSTACDQLELWELGRAGEPPSEPLCRYVGQAQRRCVVRGAFGGHAEQLIVGGSEDCGVYIWRRADGALLEVLRGHSGPVTAVAWSPAQHGLFASASDDHTVRIWGAKAPGADGAGGSLSAVAAQLGAALSTWQWRPQ